MPASEKTHGAAATYLQIKDVVKDFSGYKAVNNVSIDIAKGEIFALLGSSGCGKSPSAALTLSTLMPTVV